MKKLLIFLLAFMIVGAASGLPLFGPHQGFYNPGDLGIGGTLTVGGANIVAGSVSYDVINATIASQAVSQVTNETAINTSIAALTQAAYVNETAINATLTAMPGSIINTAYGLKNLSGDIVVNLTPDKGLEFGIGAVLGALQVEAGNGIKLSSAGVAVEPTDIIGTSYGLLDSSDDIRINLTANKGLEFGTGAALGSLQIKLDGSTLALGSSGIKVTDNTFAGKKASYTNETAINSTAANVALGQTAQNTTLANLALGQTYQNTSLTNNGLAHTAINATLAATLVNETAINVSIDALVVPLATFDYDANSVDQGVFTASGGWVLTAAKMTPRVIGGDGGGVTVMVKICDSGEAPASGDNMLSGTLDLKGTADTPQSGTVSAGTIATGKIVALDFTGTLTSAVGTITLYGTRA